MFMVMRNVMTLLPYHKPTPIKMESNVITIDDSDDEDLGNRSKLFTETVEVTAKDKTRVRDEDNGYGGVRRYKARSVEMESKTVITIDESDDSKSEDDIDIIIVDEHNEELSSRARGTVAIKTEEGLNISDIKFKVIKSEEKPEVKAFEFQEEFNIKEGNDRKPVLAETSYHMTDVKEHDMTIIKEPMEGIKVEHKYSLEWPDNSDNLTEEVSYPLCPFQYPDLSNDVKAEEYYQAKGSTEVIEDSLDSRLIIDEIKEENQTDSSFEPSYDSCSGSCETPTPDLEHTTEVFGNKTEFSKFNTETEMMTGEEENLEYSSAKEENNRVRCFTCKKSFPSQRVLAKHILNHTGGKVFRCEECHMQFILMSQLTAHKDKKHLMAFYNCKHCGVSFNTRSKLMNHVSVHTGERPYSCGGCGDVFISNSDLVEHRLKSGERPFYCEKCGARFAWKSMLRVHQKVHSEIKKCNVCPICSQAFKYSVLLLMHQISAGHGVPRWYQDSFNTMNPESYQQHGRIKLCFHMLKVAPRRVCGKLRILGKQNAAQMIEIQQISVKDEQMDVEEEMSSSSDIKGGMLSLEGAKGPKEMSTSKELNEGGCYKRVYIKQTQKPSKCCE
ncbi:hypothetical protein B7P43_G13736 [Cryptotermes secundus]|uniref:C2H2-type domain-containing protein n=1 Tax=Cryptotermes secundus TaxID=105785 RepID=A0A2J7Q5K9_9NEOP|nr:zinc finger protein 184 [Cryptotermes secundus]PNF23868.1 hypothetical protein B7P43_G13736 [Cryptotermes secundus]